MSIYQNSRVYILSEKLNKSTRAKKIKYIIKNNCWECISHSKTWNGYPKLYRKIDNILFTRMNRYVYYLYNGEIFDDSVIRHTCDNPSCINPKHLKLGTHQDNMNDMVKRNRTENIKKINIKNKRKLSNKQAINVKNMLINNYKNNKKNNKIELIKIAKKFNVSYQTIGNIKNGKSCYSEFLGGGLEEWLKKYEYRK